jgi:hypothetical protein
MSKFIAMLLAAVIAAAGVLAISNNNSSSKFAGNNAAQGRISNTALAADSEAASDVYVGDFKAGYADGFSAGAAGLGYPDQAAMTSNTRGYLDGFSQGYTDGQSQQGNLRSRLCGNAATAANLTESSTASYGSGYGRSRRVATSRVLGDRQYYYERGEVDRGIGSTARKILMIGGGAAAGAGLGGALGGKKGALIGALVGGGAGTALAVTRKPARAFNRRISKKSVLTKTLIGGGAGALIGALTGGKRGALAGGALGAGGGLVWSLLSGKRAYRR